jgi:rRNA maturation endonuclease Nob1
MQNKLLSAKAKNPYAAYASSCESCKTKTEQGKKFCQKCAYRRNGMFQVGTNFRRRSLLSYYHQRYMLTDVACPMCGKNLAGKTAKEQPVVQGQKFNLR